jgi:hypothetical protein
VSAPEPLIEARGPDDQFWPAVEPEAGWLLLRRAPPRAGGETIEVWRSYVGDRATAVFDWMTCHPDQWLLWGRIAVLFGEPALRPVVIDAARRDFERMAVEQERFRLAAEEQERLRQTIKLFILDPRNSRPGLSLESGDETKPFFVMRFSEKWERERVLDWLRWQGDRYLEFRDIYVREGAVALERLIIAGMRETEAQLKANGRSSGGRRPLRFWRGEE